MNGCKCDLCGRTVEYPSEHHGSYRLSDEIIENYKNDRHNDN